MKQTKFVFGKNGKMLAMLVIEGEKVDIVSMDPKMKSLSGKSMRLREAVEVGSVIADTSRAVSPGEDGYVLAVIDYFETQGLEVVGLRQ